MQLNKGDKAVKKYYAILETSAYIDYLLCDFCITIVDYNCKVVRQCAVLVKPGKELYNRTKHSPEKVIRDEFMLREKALRELLKSGSRMKAGVSAINDWIDKAIKDLNPELISFDLDGNKDICAHIGIDISVFKNSFSLMHAALINH